MSTLIVAKKEFKDGIRSRALLVLVVLFVLYVSFTLYTFLSGLYRFGDENAQHVAAGAISSMYNTTQIFLPLVGTLVGYNAIAGERTSGSIKLLLGLPHTRRDVVFGKLLGRSAMFVAAILVGYLWGIVVTVLVAGALPPMRQYAVLVGVAILFGMVFVSTAIAFSSAVHTQTAATRGAFGLTLVFVFVWDAIVFIMKTVVEQYGLATPPPQAPITWRPPWLEFIWELNPTNSYANAAIALNNFVSGNLFAVDSSNQGFHAPFYFQIWFGFVILALWLVVPLWLAYTRFRRMELR